jgi:hypothetical protein
VSFGSLFSMTSYETASLLKQIRPVSALLWRVVAGWKAQCYTPANRPLRSY